MTKVLLLFLISILFAGCAVRDYQDLSHYNLNDFKNEEPKCSYSSQCKFIGYGIGNGGCASSPIFKGLIVYSTKYGHTNIKHLKSLAAQSRHPYTINDNRSSPVLINVGYELEECLPVGNLKPVMQCIKNICFNVAGHDT